MPIAITEIQDTPNPNAVKCVTDRVLASTPRSYFNAEAAQADPLARSLFAVPGVVNLLFVENWVTVNKSPDAAWSKVKAGVKATLAKAD